MDIKLLKAKDAIFKLISQFHHASNLFNDEELYIYNYCSSALEAAFSILGIEENYIKLIDFCKMREDNDRAIWKINLPNEPYGGATADMYYNIFKVNHELWKKQLDDINNEELDK